MSSQVMTAEQARKLTRRPREGRTLSPEIMQIAEVGIGSAVVYTPCHPSEKGLEGCSLSSRLTSYARTHGFKVKTYHLAFGAIEDGAESLVAEKMAPDDEDDVEPDEDTDE